MDKRKIISGVCIFIAITSFVCLLSLNFYFLIANKEIVKLFLSEKLKESINKRQFEYAQRLCSLFPKMFKVTTPYGNITCKDIENKSYEKSIEEITEKLTSNFYERKLNCTVIECLKNSRWDVLLSLKAKHFFIKIQNYFVVILCLFSLFSVVIARDRIKTFKNLCVGLLLTLFGISFFNFFLSSFLSSLPQNVYEYILLKIGVFQKNVVYLSILILITLIACYLLESIRARLELLET